MSLPVYIYGLIDPRDGRVRYVGRSYRPAARLREHKTPNMPNSPGRFTPKERWMLELQSLGLMPELRIIAKVGAALAVEQERFWIQHYSQRGFALVNSTARGLAREFFNRLSALTYEAEAA